MSPRSYCTVLILYPGCGIPQICDTTSPFIALRIAAGRPSQAAITRCRSASSNATKRQLRPPGCVGPKCLESSIGAK
jgi:hypothetical protein